MKAETARKQKDSLTLSFSAVQSTCPPHLKEHGRSCSLAVTLMTNPSFPLPPLHQARQHLPFEHICVCDQQVQLFKRKEFHRHPISMLLADMKLSLLPLPSLLPTQAHTRSSPQPHEARCLEDHQQTMQKSTLSPRFCLKIQTRLHSTMLQHVH